MATSTTDSTKSKSALRQLPLPPGPSWWTMPKQISGLAQDPRGFMTHLAETWGPIMRYHIAMEKLVLVTEPELIEEVLVKKHSSFHKDPITRLLEWVLGNGLVTSEDDFWKRQRKLMAPPLTKKQIQSYADSMVKQTLRLVEKYKDNEVRDLHHDMMEVTLEIVVETLFGTTPGKQTARVGEAMETFMYQFTLELSTIRRILPRFVPVEGRKEMQRASQTLSEIIYELIQKRRKEFENNPVETEGKRNDLLTRLILARDDEGVGMTDKQLRDEAVTIFAAGHETTALALTYALYFLAGSPDTLQKLQQEVQEVLQGEPPTLADIEALTYTTAVLKESMRLYPPAWIIGREALEDLELGGYLIRKGNHIMMPQWIVHRSERWFEEPNSFKPERWIGDLEKNLPRFAFYPFGGGARVCIGNHFAMMESILILATFIQKVQFEYIPDKPFEQIPSVTLRPVHPVNMRISLRENP